MGAAHHNQKRRGILIALRAVVISSIAEKSLWQNAHCLLCDSTKTSFPLGACTLISCGAVKIPRLRSG